MRPVAVTLKSMWMDALEFRIRSGAAPDSDPRPCQSCRAIFMVVSSCAIVLMSAMGFIWRSLECTMTELKTEECQVLIPKCAIDAKVNNRSLNTLRVIQSALDSASIPCTRRGTSPMKWSSSFSVSSLGGWFGASASATVLAMTC